jgi:ribosomal protein S18 acetylase RimI-like enzyme
LLMRQAMSCTLRAGLSRLCLAVDSLNQPAIKLYHAAGMSRVGSRLAMLRDLRAS